MEFRILGPLEVTDGGRPLPISRPRDRAALSVLLLNARVLMTRTQLTDALWAEDPPRDPHGSLRSYVYSLRKKLCLNGRLQTHPAGYIMALHDEDLLDLDLFRRLTDEALKAQQQNATTSAQLLQRALSLWRDPPLADLPATSAIEPLAAGLLEQRSCIQEFLVDARLKLGHHRDLLPFVTALAAAEPLREIRWEQLMLALYRSGRQAEALNAFTRARTVLADEFGIDPGPGLRQLQQRILTADPALDLWPLTDQHNPPGAGNGAIASSTAAGIDPTTALAMSMAPASMRASWPITTPHQLPPPVQGFVGRSTELAIMSDLATNVAVAGEGSVICAISGSPGVGKSALAVHFAHQVAGAFPDGQLYIDLEGFSPSGQPLGAANAIRKVLGALGIPPEQIPAGLDTRAALYRDFLANRRVLIVADNVSGSAQVRPLLPTSQGCMLVTTSRYQLTGFASSDSALLITLDVFSDAEAREFLISRLGSARVRTESTAVTDLARSCARLPLALTIADTRVAARPQTPITELAAELQQSGHQLDVLTGAEPTADLRAVFSWSYANLTSEAARMFRLLGLHPSPEITAPAAASLVGIPLSSAMQTLAELTCACLLTERIPGRFHCHDLLRSYAAERAAEEDASATRSAAMRRLQDFHLHTAEITGLMQSVTIMPLPGEEGQEKTLRGAARSVQLQDPAGTPRRVPDRHFAA